jgi:hypothetical protein
VKTLPLILVAILSATLVMAAERTGYLDTKKGPVRIPHISHEFCVGCHLSVGKGPKRPQCSACHVGR